MLIKWLNYFSVLGDSRETQHLVPALKKLLAVLGENQSDTQAGITGTYNFS